MPVLEHASGHQPDIVFLVRHLRRRFIGHRDDPRLAILVAVELDALAGLHIGVEPLAIAPERLLAVDHRPAQPADLVVEIVGPEIMAMAAAEGGVFLEQPLLDVEAEGLRLPVLIAGIDLGDVEPVDVAVAIEHVEQGLAFVVRVGGENLGRPDLCRW